MMMFHKQKKVVAICLQSYVENVAFRITDGLILVKCLGKIFFTWNTNCVLFRCIGIDNFEILKRIFHHREEIRIEGIILLDVQHSMQFH